MDENTPEDYANAQHTALQRTFAGVQELFASKRVELDEESVAKILNGKPSHPPSFPVLMFSLGLLKDIVDFLDLTGVGVFVAFIFTVFFSIVFFFWSLGKISGGWWKKGVISWLWKRIAVVGLIEFFPFLQMVPATAILILLAHYRETKIVKLINYAMEQVHRSGSGPNARLGKQARYR